MTAHSFDTKYQLISVRKFIWQIEGLCILKMHKLSISPYGYS